MSSGTNNDESPNLLQRSVTDPPPINQESRILTNNLQQQPSTNERMSNRNENMNAINQMNFQSNIEEEQEDNNDDNNNNINHSKSHRMEDITLEEHGSTEKGQQEKQNY